MTLTAERLREVLSYNPDTGVFTRIKACKGRAAGSVAGTKSRYGKIQIDGYQYKAHRLVWLYVHGVWPPDDIDHIDGDKTNNRISNLRLATHQQNMTNIFHARRGNKTGFLGVSYNKAMKKYEAKIQVNGVQYHPGYFDTPEETSEAYWTAKRTLHPFWAQNEQGG